jgi:uncharacterized DUF497 family protein
MDIEFDPQKVAANLRKHRVSFGRVEQALRDPLGVTIGAPDAEGNIGLSRWRLMHWAGFSSLPTHHVETV